MSFDKKRIAMELAKGKTPTEVSMELGVSPSYLSQLKSDESFSALVESCKEIISIAENEDGEELLRQELKKKRDDTWDEVEEIAIIALKDKLTLGIAMKTSELLAIASVANKAVRRTEGIRGMNVEQGATVVQLNVGNVLVNKGSIVQTTVNAQNQIVAVGEQTIVNAAKDNIFARLEALKNDKIQQRLHPKKIGELPEGLTTEDL